MTAQKGPTGHQQTRRDAVLDDITAMASKLERELTRLDRRVAHGIDPQQSAHRIPPPGWIPMSFARCTRVDVETHLQAAREHLRQALGDLGYTWQDKAA